MPQSNAQRQKLYRQRQAIEKVRNEYGVTLMLEQAQLAGIDVWSVLVECANVVFEHNGDGLQFIRNAAPLAYAYLLICSLTPSRSTRPGNRL